MVKKETVLVVGAGASAEYGLPVGTELKDQMKRLLNIRFEYGMRQTSGDYIICEAFKKYLRDNGYQNPNISKFTIASNQIVDALPQAISIDNFIDAHKGNFEIELSGKLGIAKSILSAERKSTLFIDKYKNDKMNFEKIGKGWLNKFFMIITENCTVSDLIDRLPKIKMIIFNYDRCIEHYLFHAFQNYYSIPAKEASNLVNLIEFLHPYGKVGELPWQDGTEKVEFGEELNSNRLLNIALSLKTFTEGVDEEKSDIIAIRDYVLQSDTLIFLGFHYHKLNFQLLIGSSRINSKSSKNIFGTAYGISDSDVNLIKDDFLRLIKYQDSHSIELRNNLKCVELFDQYWRALSLSEI